MRRRTAILRPRAAELSCLLPRRQPLEGEARVRSLPVHGRRSQGRMRYRHAHGLHVYLSTPGWEDSAVPPDKLGSYLRDLGRLFDQYGYGPSLYGHFGQACVHCRIDFDLVSADGVRKYHAFTEDATDLVLRYGGSLSGEHGDGELRTEFLHRMLRNLNAFCSARTTRVSSRQASRSSFSSPDSTRDNRRTHCSRPSRTPCGDGAGAAPRQRPGPQAASRRGPAPGRAAPSRLHLLCRGSTPPARARVQADGCGCDARHGGFGTSAGERGKRVGWKPRRRWSDRSRRKPPPDGRQAGSCQFG